MRYFGTIRPTNRVFGRITGRTADMANYIENLLTVTHLYGGDAAALDGVNQQTLAAWPNGKRVQLGFAGRIMAQYRLRALANGEANTPATGRLVIPVGDPTRVFELEFVNKEGVPCTWDDPNQQWCQVVAAGGGAALITPGFTIPA